MENPSDNLPPKITFALESTPKRSPLAPLQWRSLNNSNSRLRSKVPCNAFTLSPLESKVVRSKRARQFGLTPPTDPYLLNQSLPCARKSPENGNSTAGMGEFCKHNPEKFTGDSLNSFSYSPRSVRERYCPTPDVYQKHDLSRSWHFIKYVETGSLNASTFSSLQNPNKIIVTINAKSTEILVANKFASLLFNINEKLPRKKLCDFIVSSEDHCCLAEMDLKPSGEIVLISGKVMDIATEKDLTTVSVWARRLNSNDEPRCLVVMEPVERVTGIVEFDKQGNILCCDDNFSMLFGYQNPLTLSNFNIGELIPLLDISSEKSLGEIVSQEGLKQCTTGRTKDCSSFPLKIDVKPYHVSSNSLLNNPGKVVSYCEGDTGVTFYKAEVQVFNNISGMITLLPDGTINSCNTNFSLMLFGYSQNQLHGQNITKLIPSFYEDLEFLDTDSMALPPLEEDEDGDSNARYCCASDGRTTAESSGSELTRPMNPMGKHFDIMLDETIEEIKNLVFTPSPTDDNDLLHQIPIPSVTENAAAEIDCLEVKILESCNDHLGLDDLSESSSHPDHSSKQLSISEAQDTLHSCTNSITESDVNANVLDPLKYDDCKNQLEKEEPEEDDENYDSDSSDSDESLSSLAEDFESDSSSCVDNKSPVDFQGSVTDSEVKDSKNRSAGFIRCASESNLGMKPPVMGCSTPRGQSCNAVTSQRSEESSQSIQEGGYYGVGRHRDGTNLAVEYHIKKVELEDGKFLYCLWVSRDSDEIESRAQSKLNNACTSFRSGRSSATSDRTTSQESQLSSSCSSINDSDSVYTSGVFSEKYSILQQIGKGAFGCVKKAYRNSDGLLIIAKFILKSSVYSELWVHDNYLNKKVPLEISLLTTVNHPNIVKVLDIFENEKYFQLVMEKHGSGMDLFEFIERRPNLDEALSSYIFRQVASALSYLHSLSVLHRDIKDENIILDEKFHIKLIDFGSAAFMSEELFSTFCGTMEYCSPEVIQGNRYRGPELEMWALGVTLYTLIFGENPFIDVDETLKCDLRIPTRISSDLEDLIRHLLEPDPLKRCTLKEVSNHPWTNMPVFIERYVFAEVVNASIDEINPPKYITCITVSSPM